MKYEWKKAQKACYNIKAVPTLTEVPAQSFIMIDGEGNPNAPDFSERVSALYALAYAVKMDYKKASAGCEIDDFTVYPLEGIWRRKTQKWGLRLWKRSGSKSRIRFTTKYGLNGWPKANA